MAVSRMKSVHDTPTLDVSILRTSFAGSCISSFDQYVPRSFAWGKTRLQRSMDWDRFLYALFRRDEASATYPYGHDAMLGRAALTVTDSPG